jgi:DNA-directed RNA polymerase specialized sigma24 family protein
VSLSKRIVIAPSELALAKTLVSDMDLLRLKAIARLHARGLPPDVSWDDLLQESFARLLSGARRPPPGVPMVVFLAGVMRSLKSEHWRRVAGHAAALETDSPAGHSIEAVDSRADPERALSAYQELAGLQKLFDGDEPALHILTGLAEGRLPEEIRLAAGLGKRKYDSARKRIRRMLLRQGLTFCHP